MTPLSVRRNDGGLMSVRSIGSGPPLVCVAGGPGRNAEYLGDLGGLSSIHRLIMPDARGTGSSDDPCTGTATGIATSPNSIGSAGTDEVASTGWEVEAIAGDLEPAREALGLETIDMLAHSAGCTAALFYVAQHAARVSRLILVTPSPRGFSSELADSDRVRAGRSHEPLVQRAIAARDLLMADPPPDDEEIPGLVDAMTPSFYGDWTEDARRHAAAESGQVNVAARANFYGPHFSLDGLHDRLLLVDAPVLVLSGDRDCVAGVSMGKHIAGLFRRGEHQTLSGAGHFPWIDDPVGFGESVATFLRDSDGGGT